MRNFLLLLVFAPVAACSSGTAEYAIARHFNKLQAEQLVQVTYSGGGNFACAELKTNKRAGRHPGHIEGYLVKTGGKWTYDHDFEETHLECVQRINIVDPKRA